MFEKLQKQAKEAQERWNKINEKAEELQKTIDEPFFNVGDCVRQSAELLLLLVEQLKPISQTQSEDFTKSILDMFGGKSE